MKTAIIRSFADLHQQVSSHNRNIVIYRGLKSTEYDLTPRLGRENLDAADPLAGEQTILRLFKERAYQYVSDHGLNRWDWLALAQHHGLPTRLMDWTRNPLVAAYFAVEEEHDGDSVIWVLRERHFINTERYGDPFERMEVGRFIPNDITRRITAQAGVFTIHPEWWLAFESSNLDRIIIKNKNDFRRQLKRTLFHYGVHRASLFPDLDGLAAHITWLRTRGH
jgi:hypothetical protein